MSEGMAKWDLLFICMAILVFLVVFSMNAYLAGQDPEDDLTAPEIGEQHINPMAIFGALVVLTVLELCAPMVLKFHFGVLVTALMVMAFFKAGLVGFYFMHLKFEGAKIFAWLGLSIFGILSMMAGIAWDISVIYG
jgi:caa(3)-type oxidase subunit IV